MTENPARSRFVSYGWMVAFAGMLVTTAFAFTNSYSVFFPALSQEFNWNRAQVASIFAAYNVTYGVFVTPVGYLVERVSARRVILLGAFLAAGGMALTGIGQTLWQLQLCYGVLGGLGSAALFATPLFVVSQWFQGSRRKGLALGIAASGAIGIVYPIIANNLIGTIGWRQTYIVSAVLLFGLIALATFFMRSPRGRPGETRAEPGTARQNEGAPAASDRPQFTVLEALRTRHFWILYGSFCVGLVGLTVALVHLVPLAKDRHIEESVAAGALSVIIACGVAARILMGALSDRIGRKRVFILSYGAQALALLWLIVSNQAWMIYVFAFVLGTAWGGWFTAYAPIFGDYFGLKHFSTIFSLASSTFGVASLVGPYMAGYIFDHTGSYTASLIAAASLTAVAAASSLFLRPPSKRASMLRPGT